MEKGRMSTWPTEDDRNIDRLLDLVEEMPGEQQQVLLRELEERLSRKKRRFERKSLFLALDYEIQGRSYRDFTQNISAGGLFIETRMFTQSRMPFAVGERVAMSFCLPGRQNPVQAAGEIVRTCPQGIGVSFDLTGQPGGMLNLEGLRTIHECFLGSSGNLFETARVRRKKIRWRASLSPDVAGYKLYWKVGKGVDFDSDCAELGNATEVILPDQVPSFPLIAGDVEIGVTAVNHMGNESDMVKFRAFFNFAAPDAPTNLTVEDL